MNNAKGWVVLAVVFFSGLVLGASSATVWFTQNPAQAPRPAAGKPGPEMIVEHLARVVGLDEAQKADALEIFRRHEPEVQAVMESRRHDMDAILDATMAELRPSLSAEQNVKLDEFVARIKQGPGPGMGPGGPGMGPGGPGMGPGGPGDISLSSPQ